VDRGKQKKTWILETQEQKQINKNRMSTVAWLPNYIMRNTNTL
jgi:hypothetical protein